MVPAARASPLHPVPVVLVAAAVAVSLAVASPARAQQAPAPDTAGVDSTRVRIFERLRHLGQGPGIDSLQLAEDTMRILMREEGRQGRAVRGGGGARSWDSTSTALLELEGYTPTSYVGERAQFEAVRRRLTLHGDSASKPQVFRQEMAVTADSSIVYDEETGRVRALGDALYEPENGDPVESSTLVLDLSQRRGTALGASTEYAQGNARWIVHGDLPSVEPELVYGSQTTFTSCDLEEPHYHFATDRIKIHQDRVLVARPVRLYFADVPVAWLPFIAQGLGDDRSSGLLTPRFSVNDIVRTSRGYSRRISNVGFYWAMSDYTDATVALDWFSGNFLSVTSNLRYNWSRQFLQGDVNLRRFWREEGGSELALNTRHAWEISERTRFSASANYASSTDFVRRNSFDPREVTRQITSQGGFNHRFDWGTVNLGANRRQS
ncbi:MAG TPA: putative LPS assembly protein LptD, partial [Longimicrobiales bacterium]|nr:putative LPS assembly protein LptD [Longimicrobiales bacterium]